MNQFHKIFLKRDIKSKIRYENLIFLSHPERFNPISDKGNKV